MAMHEIKLDRAECKICHDCIENILMGGKPDKLRRQDT